MSLVIFFMSPLPLLFLSLVLCLNKERLESLVFATRTTHKRKKKRDQWSGRLHHVPFFFSLLSGCLWQAHNVASLVTKKIRFDMPLRNCWKKRLDYHQKLMEVDQHVLPVLSVCFSASTLNVGNELVLSLSLSLSLLRNNLNCLYLRLYNIFVQL